MKYCYRENGASSWFVTDSLKCVHDCAEVYHIGSKLTPEGITVIKHEEDVKEAERDASRAEEKLRAAQDRLRIQRIKTGIEA